MGRHLNADVTFGMCQNKAVSRDVSGFLFISTKKFLAQGCNLRLISWGGLSFTSKPPALVNLRSTFLSRKASLPTIFSQEALLSPVHLSIGRILPLPSFCIKTSFHVLSWYSLIWFRGTYALMTARNGSRMSLRYLSSIPLGLLKKRINSDPLRAI